MPCQPLQPEDILIKGDLYARARVALDRLEKPDYRAAQLYRSSELDWPGDVEGRTLLALLMLARWTHLDLRTVDDIMRELPGHLNAEGCFGPLQSSGKVDEQQLGAHTWVLRALVEHYRWRRQPETKAMVLRIVETLVIPAATHFAKYPSSASDRSPRPAGGDDDVVGARTQTVGSWTLSSDVGIAFSILDGATHAYEALDKPAPLKSALELIIAAYIRFDPVALGAHTHATLTALRGLIHYHSMHPSPAFLTYTQKIYAAYTTTTRTETYTARARLGLFPAQARRTDPCAVIDSLALAVELWRVTLDPSYLDDAHHIYYNALLPAQRPSGGFGHDTPTGPPTELHLVPLENPLYETIRCTTRGGEGLATAAALLYYVDPQADTAFVCMYHCSTATLRFADGHLVVRQTTTYPVDGWIRLDLLESTVKTPKTLQLFLPDWASPAELPTSSIHGRFVEAVFSTNHTILVRFDIAWHREQAVTSQSLYTLRHGPLLLGASSRSAAEKGRPIEETVVRLAEEAKLVPLGQASYLVEGTAVGLSALVDLVGPLDSLERGNRKQVLFPGA